MLIRLLRKIAGLRAADFYLTCWEKGGKEGRRKSFNGPKNICSRIVFYKCYANACGSLTFPGKS